MRQVSHLILPVYWVRFSFLVEKILLFLQDMHIYHAKCALVTHPVELCRHNLDMKARTSNLRCHIYARSVIYRLLCRYFSVALKPALNKWCAYPGPDEKWYSGNWKSSDSFKAGWAAASSAGENSSICQQRQQHLPRGREDDHHPLLM